MKAIAIKRYGLPPQLEWVDKPIPEPEGNAIRIRVLRSSVNDWDVGMVTGKLLMMRAFYGLIKPNRIMPGCDVAGIVDAVGSEVQHFATGDKVYGDLHGHGFGAFAAFACAPETAFRRIPPNLTLDQAGALPHALTLAWQGLNRYTPPEAGQRILINGAGGGFSAKAVSSARWSSTWLPNPELRPSTVSRNLLRAPEALLSGQRSDLASEIYATHGFTPRA